MILLFKLFIIAICFYSANAQAILSINVSLKESKTPFLIYDMSSNNNISHNIDRDIKNKFSFFSNIKLYKPIANKTCQENAKNLGITSYCINQEVIQLSESNYLLKLGLIYSSSNNIKKIEIPFTKDNYNKVSDIAFNTVYKEVFKKETFINSKIAYVKSFRKNNKNWYSLNIANYDMSEEKRILVSPEPITSISWSKDNSKIAYTSFENIRPAIYIYNLKNDKIDKLISLKGINDSPSWSPDGNMLAFSLSKQIDSDIYFFNFKNNKLIKLTKSRAIDTEPVWIDNNNIVFTSSRLGNPRLFKIDIRNNNIEKIDTNYNYITTPTYSNNTLLSIVKNNNRYGLLKMNLDNKIEDIIKVDFYAESPSIASDGEIIYYISKENNKNFIKIINMSGESLFNLKSDFNIKDVKISN